VTLQGSYRNFCHGFSQPLNAIQFYDDDDDDGADEGPTSPLIYPSETIEESRSTSEIKILEFISEQQMVYITLHNLSVRKHTYSVHARKTYRRSEGTAHII